MPCAHGRRAQCHALRAQGIAHGQSQGPGSAQGLARGRLREVHEGDQPVLLVTYACEEENLLIMLMRGERGDGERRRGGEGRERGERGERGEGWEEGEKRGNGTFLPLKID